MHYIINNYLINNYFEKTPYFKNLFNPIFDFRIPSTTSSAISSAPSGEKCVLSSTPFG